MTPGDGAPASAAYRSRQRVARRMTDTFGFSILASAFAALAAAIPAHAATRAIDFASTQGLNRTCAHFQSTDAAVKPVEAPGLPLPLLAGRVTRLVQAEPALDAKAARP